MRTVDTPAAFHPGPLGRLRRDISLLVRLIRMSVGYATEGRRIRSSYQRAEAAGEVYWVDDVADSGPSER